MKLISYDFEVFKYDWVVVFQELITNEFQVFHNNSEALYDYMDSQPSDYVVIGFNSKHYDQYILKAILLGATNGIVKNINDWIMNDNQGWEHPFFKNNYLKLNCADIRDDCQKGLSLKSIEGHMGMDIEECSVPFDIDRPLTEQELEEVIRYCKHDVMATTKLIRLRKDYITTKIRLSRLGGIDPIRGVGMTNAKLTARYLGARKKAWFDSRDYVYPKELKKEYIPTEVLRFFETIWDKSQPDPVPAKTSLNTVIGGCPVTVSWGGIHGSRPQSFAEASDLIVVQNRDIVSLYPSLMIEYNYMSRNIESPERYIQTYKRRVEAKAQGHEDGKTLKLPLNTASGAGESPHNDMFDPLPTRSLRITGQLFMIELACRMIKHIPTFKLLQLNTDGIMYSVSRKNLPMVDKMCADWEKEKRLVLEIDDINRVWQKDTNNMLMELTNGKIKKAGGYLNYGHHEKAGFNISNNFTIVADAIQAHLLHGTPVKETIGKCNDPLKFQLIAHSGIKFSRVFQIDSSGTEIELQKTNRIYATKQRKKGAVYRVTVANGEIKKITNCPDYCTVDNRNEIKIEDIDKQWYVELATKRIADYRGSGQFSLFD